MTNRVVVGVTEAYWMPPGDQPPLWVENWGMRVSLPGLDVMSDLAENQYAFNSNWQEMLQVYQSGSAVLSDTTLSYEGTYYRLATFTSLGYVPEVLVWNLSVRDAALDGQKSLLVTSTAIYVGFNFYANPANNGLKPSGTFAYIVTKTPLMG